MLSTARMTSSPGCGRRPLFDAPRRRAVAKVIFLQGDDGRRAASIGVHAPRPRSNTVAARAASSTNPAGCLEAAAPWSGVARPAPSIMDDDAAAPAVSSEQRVRQLVLKQAPLAAAAAARPPRTARLAGCDAGALGAAFDRCGAVCKEYAKTFYLGKPSKQLSY